MIDDDVRRAGGDGVEPHFGSMSEEAIAFWETRRPDLKGKLDALNKLGVVSSGSFD